MTLDLADFALQGKTEDNLMPAISWAWYNGSYTMSAKSIKSLELHYTMILGLALLFMCNLPLNNRLLISNKLSLVHPLENNSVGSAESSALLAWSSTTRLKF